MEWIALAIVGLWFLLLGTRNSKIESDIDRLERVQGGQLYREAHRYPPSS
jgi:hypothetical protein